MTEMQTKLLDLMKWFHDLCVRENLTYFAAGGTALGAVRHKGFIPWDDDIDVGMPRKDYEKLLRLSKKINGQSDYYIEFPQGQKDYIYSFCKIYDTRTTQIELTRYKLKRGIYIDVFPIDGIGNSKEECMKNYKLVHKEIVLLRMLVISYKKNRAFYKRILVAGSRCIPKFILNHVKLIKKIDTLSKRCDYDTNNYVVNYSGAWGEKEIIKREWIGTPVLSKFEGIDIYVPSDVDSYLSTLYGDYMKLPPVEKRCSHHEYLYLNLHESYLKK